MKKIDFSKTGGLPFTQDRLNYMQTSYTEALTALAYARCNVLPGANVPMALYGMVKDPLANTITNGWLIYNGEMMPFTGGNTLPGAGNDIYIVINPTSNSLNYNDGNAKAVLLDKSASLSELVNTTATDGTKCRLSTLLYSGQPSAYLTLTGSVTDGTATWTRQLQYRYDPYKNIIRIKGWVSFSAGYPTAGTDLYPVNVGTMVSDYGINYGINNPVGGFTARVGQMLNNITSDAQLPDTSGGHFASIDGYIGSAGDIILLLKPSAGLNNHGSYYYPVYINVIIPCD